MAAPQQNSSPRSTGQRASETLFGASLIAFSGGALDACLYLDHGKVFAGAMTGNAVLSGIALLSDDPHDAFHHALPLLAFFVGVWLAEVLQDRIRTHAVAMGLACEIAGLVIASFLPTNFPNDLFVPFIALLAAYQIATFRKVDEFTYNCTFITGNLRTAIFGLHQALHPESRKEGLRQARDLGTVVGSFMAGATAGALLARHVGNHTLWLPVASLIVVLVLVVRRTERLRAAGQLTHANTGSS